MARLAKGYEVFWCVVCGVFVYVVNGQIGATDLLSLPGHYCRMLHPLTDHAAVFVALHNERACFGVPLGVAGSGLVVGIALAPHSF